MKEPLVANVAQNLYSGMRRDSAMPEPPKEREAPRQQTPQQVQEYKRISTYLPEQRKAFEAVDKYVLEELSNKTRQHHRGRLGSRAPEREPVRRVPGPVLERQAYFPQPVVNPVLHREIEEFCIKAGGKGLQQLDTSFLSYEYVKLRRRALEIGHDTSFLHEIRTTLTRRDIDTNALENRADQVDRIAPMGGGAPDDLPTFPPSGSIDERAGSERLNAIIRRLNSIREDQRPRHLDNINAEIELIRRGMVEGALPLNYSEQTLDRLNNWVEAAQQYTTELNRNQSRRGLYRNIELSERDKKQIEDDVDKLVSEQHRLGRHLSGGELGGENIDKLYNRIYRLVNRKQRADFHAAFGQIGEFERNEFMDYLNDLYAEAENAHDHERREIIEKLQHKYEEEHHLRELMHNVYYIADTGGDFQNFANFTKQFASELADLTFLGSPEVEVALRIREQVLYQIKQENYGYIPYEKISYYPEDGYSEFEERSRMLLESANNSGLFAKDGKTGLEDWQIDRALALSRGFGMVTLRFPEIVAEQNIQRYGDGSLAQRSVPWETITWDLNFLDHKIKRYQIGRAARAILYYDMLRGKKKGMWSQNELQELMEVDLVNNLSETDGVQRLVDIRNLFRGGGPWSNTGWRGLEASLDEYGNDIRDLLKTNPGLASKLLFNRHRINGQNERKRTFLEEYRRNHPNASDEAMGQAWKQSRDANHHEAGAEYRAEDGRTWQEASRRIPYVILRVFLDKANKMLSEEERQALQREIFGEDKYTSAVGEAGIAYQRLYNQTTQDLAMAKEQMMKRRRDKIERGEKWTPADDEIKKEDFGSIKDEHGHALTPDRIDLAMHLKNVVMKRIGLQPEGERPLTNDERSRGAAWLKKLTDASAGQKFPFAVSLEDTPFGEFRFAQAGGRGFITRKMNDTAQDFVANGEVGNFLNNLRRYSSPEEIVAQLNKIHDAARVHDEDRSKEVITYLARGLIRFYQKDGINKIPLIGQVVALKNRMNGRGNSFAQTAFGITEMEWDDDDIYNFLEQLRKTILDKDQVDAIRKDVGGSLWRALIARSKVSLLLLMLVFAGTMFEEVTKAK